MNNYITDEDFDKILDTWSAALNGAEYKSSDTEQYVRLLVYAKSLRNQRNEYKELWLMAMESMGRAISGLHKASPPEKKVELKENWFNKVFGKKNK